MKQPRLVWTLRVTLVLSAFFAGAGGLALAALSWFAALAALMPKALIQALSRPPLPLVLVIVAIAWTCLSLTWSPYERPDQALKLALLSPLYLALPFLAAQLDETGRKKVRPLIVFAAAGCLLYLVMETVFHAPMTVSYKLGVENHDTDFATLMAMAERQLARGTVFALMLTGPAMLLLWRTRSRSCRIGAVCLLVLAFLAASGLGVEANLAGLLLALGLGALALRFPRRTLQVFIVATSAILMLAPALFTAGLALLPDFLRDAMPLSWAWRLEIWEHTLALIAERPITGHGLDIARVVDTSSMLRGMEIDLLPLHAHNAMLNIWLETGFVGALTWAFALNSLAVWLGRRPLGRDLCLMLVYVAAIWLVSVMLGIGVWQEWHHGALSLAIASALLCTSPALARPLRHSA